MASEWPVVRIEEIAEKIAMGPFGSNIKVETFVDTGVPIISGAHLRETRLKDGKFNFVTEEHAERLKNSNVYRGDVVFTHAGNIGQVAYIPPSSKYERYVISQRQFYLRCNLSKAIPAFIAYFFKSHEGQYKLLANASQTGVPSIARPSSYLKTIELTLPPIEEQRAIAHILGTLDDKIELNRRQNETLEAMARALFKAWFVDFEPVRAKMDGRWQRGQSLPGLPAHLYDLFPDRLVESELGLIPEGWKNIQASQLIEFNPAERLKRGVVAPYIGMALLPTSGSWIEPPPLRKYTSGMRFRNGDTLFARITPSLENGKTAFVQCLPEGSVGWGSTEYIVMRSKPPVPQAYSYLLAREGSFRASAIQSMTGTSGRQRVQRKSVENFIVSAPENKSIWGAFERLVSPVFESIKTTSKTSKTLEGVHGFLLPKVVSGKLFLSKIKGFK